MKKLLLILLFLVPAIVFAQSSGGGSDDGPNSIYIKDPDQIDDNRTQVSVDPSTAAPLFSADILIDHSILITSTKVSSFSVKVCRQDTSKAVYSGETLNSTIHITSDFSDGLYTLEIICDDKTYMGNFQIIKG